MNQPLRPRAILLGVLLGLGICLATPWHNILHQGTLLGGGHFPLAPFLLLLVLAVLAAGVNRLLGPGRLLTGRELLAAWMLMVVTSGLAYTGLARAFLQTLTTPLVGATPGNRWAQLIQPLLPEGLYPHDARAVELLYNGLPRDAGQATPSWLEVLRQIPWDAWVGPLAGWLVFILASYGLMLCLAGLFSRQWIENERLDTPLLRLPMALADSLDKNGERGGLRGLLTDPFLLLGLAVPVALHTINGLSFYYPQIPAIPTLLLAKPYVPATGLFAGFGKLRLHFYPALIGFAFLTSRQISLSFWSFHLLGALLVGALGLVGLSAPASGLGVTFGPTLALPEETQSIGATLVFFLFLLWLARRHLWLVLRAAVGRAGAEAAPSASEWLPMAACFWGAVACGAVLWGWLIHFGMAPLPAALTLGAFVASTVVAARVICQGGIAYFTQAAAPLDGLLAAFGSPFFGPLGHTGGLLLAAAAQKILYLDLRESLFPSLIHATKVTEDARPKRLFLAGLVAALLLGVVVSLGAMLVLGYGHGLRSLNLEWETRTTAGVYENVQRLLEAPAGPNRVVLAYAGLGAVVMLGLIFCYHRFFWWPVHPIGYLTAYSSSMRVLWFSFFIGWAANELVLRYGGMGLYRRVRLLFLGLIIGDMLMGGIWAVVGHFAGSSYMVLPD